MHKQFQEDRYLYWSVISSVLQVGLFQMLLVSSWTWNRQKMLQRRKQCAQSFTSSHTEWSLRLRHLPTSTQIGSIFTFRFSVNWSFSTKLVNCSTAKLAEIYVPLVCRVTKYVGNFGNDRDWCGKKESVPRSLLGRKGEWVSVSFCFLTDCFIIRDRNWLEFLAVLDATFDCLVISPTDVAPTTLEDAKKECATRVQETRVLFTWVVEEDGCKDRSGLLALLELEKRARDHGVSEGMCEVYQSPCQYRVYVCQNLLVWLTSWRDTLTRLATKYAASKI